MKDILNIVFRRDASNLVAYNVIWKIRLPRIIMEAMSLKTDDPITIEVVNPSELIIRKRKTAAADRIAGRRKRR